MLLTASTRVMIHFAFFGSTPLAIATRRTANGTSRFAIGSNAIARAFPPLTRESFSGRGGAYAISSIGIVPRASLRRASQMLLIVRSTELELAVAIGGAAELMVAGLCWLSLTAGDIS